MTRVAWSYVPAGVLRLHTSSLIHTMDDEAPTKTITIVQRKTRLYCLMVVDGHHAFCEGDHNAFR